MLDLFDSTWEDLWGAAAEAEPVGAVFTKVEIVRLILDLADYHPDRADLSKLAVLEPSCGDGAFLTEVVQRLCASLIRRECRSPWADSSLDGLLRASDISTQSVEAAREAVVRILTEAGCPRSRARRLATRWIVRCDFLIEPWDFSPDLVVGNPPYVRIEDLPKRVMERYRKSFDTVRDRADLYVAFVERGLQMLSPNGVLAYICANRFSKNQYGRSLRALIASRYRVRHYINLEHTQPFEQDVSAYPAIIVLDREVGQPTRAATLTDVGPATLTKVRASARSGSSDEIVSVFPTWYSDGGPWLTTSLREQSWFETLAGTLPTLEQSAEQVTVGIGCATGADNIFVLDGQSDDIETSRQLPLAMAQDIGNGGIKWSGHFLINPFDDETGAVVDLAKYPGFRNYLIRHSSDLKRRYISRSSPDAWFRTIDRIWPRLVGTPKLLLPDIQGTTTVGLDGGAYYPHHNLYYVSSPIWNLRALKCLFRSSFVRRQVNAFSVQMRGGSVRFQAQTLRRLRVPSIADIPPSLMRMLDRHCESAEQALIDDLVNRALRLISPKLAPQSP